jgi:hypothetical protein
MKFTASDFDNRYASMSDRELAMIRKEDLTPTARVCYEREVARREAAPACPAVPAQALQVEAERTKYRAARRRRESSVHMLLVISSVVGLIRFLGKFPPYVFPTNLMDLVWASCLGGAALISFPALRRRDNESHRLPGTYVTLEGHHWLLIFSLAILVYAALCAYEILSPGPLSAYEAFFCGAKSHCLSGPGFQTILLVSWCVGWAWLGLSLLARAVSGVAAANRERKRKRGRFSR